MNVPADAEMDILEAVLKLDEKRLRTVLDSTDNAEPVDDRINQVDPVSKQCDFLARCVCNLYVFLINLIRYRFINILTEWEQLTSQFNADSASG